MDPAPVIYLPPPLDLPLADVVVNVVDGDDGDDPMEGVEEDYEEDGAVDGGGGTPSEDGECAAADIDIDSGDSDVTHGIIFFHCTCFFFLPIYTKNVVPCLRCFAEARRGFGSPTGDGWKNDPCHPSLMCKLVFTSLSSIKVGNKV